MWDGGFQDYVHDWWNLMDFVMNSLYLATISLKIVAYTKVTNNLRTAERCSRVDRLLLYSQFICPPLFVLFSTAVVNPGTSGRCGTQL